MRPVLVLLTADEFRRRAAAWFRRPAKLNVQQRDARGGVPNFLTSHPPEGAWGAIERVLRGFLRLKVDAKIVCGDDEDIFAATLATPRLHELVRDTGHLPEAYPAICAFALAVAHNKRVDVLEARRRQQEAATQLFPDYGTRARRTTRGGGARMHCPSGPCAGTNRVEARAAEWLDARRGVRALTATFDVEEYWREVRDWAARKLRLRFDAAWLGVPGVSKRSDLVDVRIDGHALSPEEATWFSLAHGARPAIDLDTTTTPEDAHAREYEAVYRAFWRARQPAQSAPTEDPTHA